MQKNIITLDLSKNLCNPENLWTLSETLSQKVSKRYLASLEKPPLTVETKVDTSQDVQVNNVEKPNRIRLFDWLIETVVQLFYKTTN